MNRLLLGIVVGAFGLFAYQRAHQQAPEVSSREPAPENALVEQPGSPSFHCDGRIHCSQMTSCDEADYFLQHCPGVKMDGDKDGLPCEDKCGH